MSPRFELWRGEAVLGVVTFDPDQSESPWYVGWLAPSPSYGEVRPLFDAMCFALEDRGFDDRSAHLREQILVPGVRMRSLDDGEVSEVVEIHIEGHRVRWRERVRPVTQSRGLAIREFGCSDRFFFVEAPIERAAGLYVERTKAGSWERDVASRCASLNEKGDIFYQLRGHRWTGVYILRDHPLTFSRLLDCKVIEFFHQNTTAALGYQVFDRGEDAESFEFAPDAPPHFRSRLREVDLSQLSDLSDMSDPRPFDPIAFIDTTFRLFDLYAVHPPLDGFAGEDVSSPGVRREDFERVDIVGRRFPRGRKVRETRHN